jgi:hypothetical protein
MRKEAGLAVSDRIWVWLKGNDTVERAVLAHMDHIAAEVLAREINVGVDGPADANVMQTVDLDGLSVNIAIKKGQ